MNTHQNKTEYQYVGTENLVLIEDALINYNKWIVGKFIRVFSGIKRSDASVLDFGAGLGTLCKIFYQKTGVKPDAVDADPSHRAILLGGGFRTYSALSELREDYDLIYTSNVLEHIENDHEILESLKFRLRKNGILLIYVPAFEMLWTSMDDMVGHVRRYRKNDLIQKLRIGGYDVQYAGYCDSVGFVLSLVFKMIGKKGGEMPLRALRFYDTVLLPISKIMDTFFSAWFGKNLYVIAKKSDAK